MKKYTDFQNWIYNAMRIVTKENAPVPDIWRIQLHEVNLFQIRKNNMKSAMMGFIGWTDTSYVRKDHVLKLQSNEWLNNNLLAEPSFWPY